MTQIILFVLGFYVLIKASNVLVDGAVSLSKLLKISSWFVGVVVVGIGTSTPELSISLASSFSGNDIGVGTIIGGNIFNLLFVLGLSAIIFPAYIEKFVAKTDFVENFLAVLLALLFLLFPVFGDSNFSGISQSEGWILFVVLILWLGSLFMRRNVKEEKDDLVNVRVFTAVVSSVMVLVGIIGVYIGGYMVVNGAEYIATLFGLSPAFIGLTIIGIGTSIPELVVSVTAALKKQTHIAVGNIIGSNIFNFLGVFGMASLLKGTPVASHISFDIWYAFGASILLWLALYIGRIRVIDRSWGIFMILGYIVYLVILFIRVPIL